MSIVVCQLPKAGLGNQLFPLMKAALFAELNQLPLHVFGYNQFKIGPYLRGEKSKRKYSGYFLFQKGLLLEQAERLKMLKYGSLQTVEEPVVEQNKEVARADKKYLFSKLPHWNDYFLGLRENRTAVIDLFWKLLNPDIITELKTREKPSIGVHIRMGDFRKLAPGEDFRMVGAVRTPEDYFIDVINQIRSIHGSDLPVSVFTDGYPDELKKLMVLKDISIVEGNPDILDMLLLSRSKIIVTSAGSTFSYWAGFLSESPVIMHADHIHEPIRYRKGFCEWYEGGMNPADPLLISAIKNIS